MVARLKPELITIRAELLSPFYYHGLFCPDGTATDPNVLSDTSVMFALRTAFTGLPSVLNLTPNYKADLGVIPWRSTLFMGEGNSLHPPIRHSIDVEREGGFPASMQKNMGSGYYKKVFFVHPVKEGAVYQGGLWGPNPFTIAERDSIVIRVGVGKQGLIRLTMLDNNELPVVRLNTATALIFGRQLAEDYRILDTIRVSKPLSLTDVSKELSSWTAIP